MRDTEVNESALWVAVLAAVVADIQTKSFATERQRSAAISWVGLYPSRDFRMVCSLAGMDPEAVHDRLRRLINRNKERRARVARKERVAGNDNENFDPINGSCAWNRRTAVGGHDPRTGHF